MTEADTGPMQKQRLTLDIDVSCPECNDGAAVRFSRKSGRVKVQCSGDCGIVRDEVIPYGAGATLTTTDIDK